MCLRIVYKKRKPPKTGTGWKIFSGPENRLRFRIYALEGSCVVQRGRWIKADHSTTISASRRSSYRSGFHVYLRKPELEPREGILHVVEVEYRKARTLGIDGIRIGGKNMLTVVADEIYVPVGAQAAQVAKVR